VKVLIINFCLSKVSAFDLGTRQKSDTIRLQLSWVESIWSRSAPEFVDSMEDHPEIFEHVDVGYVVDESLLQRTIALLQATDLDSDRLWFKIVGTCIDTYTRDVQRFLLLLYGLDWT